MFKIIKLKNILIAILLIVCSILCSIGIAVIVENKEIPSHKYTIVIDAGHGGRDNGCSGINSEVAESKINLDIAKKLATTLTDYDFKVIMTRNDTNGLYDENASNYKTSDMNKRIEIIDSANADFVISIHCNSYPKPEQKGIQAFYQAEDQPSKALADSMQDIFLNHLPNARKNSNFGDYYILKESKTHAVLIECGYLTNPEEDALLNNAEYQQKIAYAITCGLIKYFNHI